ncbi:hypothetical protein Q1695_015754 [Nippostrongylus brasiliensis]|nr:hypothetical protein Q1695_015754 [Nippostrongylus brasiliensis]
MKLKELNILGWYHYSPGHPHPRHPSQQSAPMMLRTRQFPEVAGIYGCDEQPALRRFTRYNHTMIDAPVVSAPPPSTAFSKNSKKPSFFSGNWTFRDRKPSRPAVVPDAMRREDRPVSVNISEARAARSKSEAASRQVEVRVPVKVERPPPSDDDEQHRRTRKLSEGTTLFKTSITVDDSTVAVMRPKKEFAETNNNRYSYNSSNPLRKSCPDLDTASATGLPMSEERGPRRRNRRAKEKVREACWKRKPVEDWSLDDVLLWLQACSLDDVASLLIGYDLRGEDLLSWDHSCLSQLGVTNVAVREKILNELAAIRERGPEETKEEKRSGHRALFDIVRQSAYDQVLAVETPLTTRDIIVTHGRLGCLQITKVNGVNLPLRENDCLLEINDCPGEQFKSALMLTKLISDSNGSPIRFVVLRMKTVERADDTFNDTSSSGVSSSPRSPSE